jgi:hypothetical protein
MVRIELCRTLQMLSGAPHGCTEAIMLANGFTAELLSAWCDGRSRRPRRGSCMPATGRSR